MGLRRLRAMPTPRITHPAEWISVCQNAQTLVDLGWAPEAITLGWHPLDLFGCSADGGFEGLAVWLRRRRLALIDNRSAIAVGSDARRHIFNRRTDDSAVYLWDLGVQK